MWPLFFIECLYWSVIDKLVIENGHRKGICPDESGLCTQNNFKLHLGLTIEHNWEDLHNHLKRTCIFILTFYTFIQW